MQYNELNVRVEVRDDGDYDVFASGEAGEAAGILGLPFSDLEVENFVLRVGRTRQGTRRLESPEMTRAREFGGRLFDALFNSRVRDLYRDCFASARADGKGLRLKLSLGRAPDLADVPWEYLYDSPAFLSISRFTPIVRYLELPRARAPLAVEHPLRILAMVSAPTGVVALDVEAERHKVEEALRERLIQRDLIEITWLEEATLRALQRELRRRPYHVFHFIGHGTYDPELGESVLLLEDDDERARRVSGTELGTILADHTSLRLAVLNACEGARTSRDDPFSGVAAALVQHELPAVIAMQFEITDRAAITFAEEFYAALVEGLPVDAALAETRKAIYADGNDVEWGTPVLFMRVRDGRVFDLPTPAVDGPRAAEREEAERVEAERLGQEQTEREQAERAAHEQAEAESSSREEAERVEAERVEAEQATADRAGAERAAQERSEREAAELAARKQAGQKRRTPRTAALRRLIPRRTRTRVLAALTAVALVAGAVFGALLLTGVLFGEPGTVYGNTVDFTPVKPSKATAYGYLVEPGGLAPEYLEIYGDVGGKKTDRFEILLFSDLSAVKAFTKLPPGTKRLATGYGGYTVVPWNDGSLSGSPDLPANYRDYAFVGITRKHKGDPVRHLELYALMSKFSLTGE